jgi:hypothetical protein
MDMEKCRKDTLIRQNHLTNLEAAKNGFILLLGWCSFKIKKEKWAGLHLTSMELSDLVLTPLRIR